MDTIFMNSGNSKTSDRHRLLPNLSNEINLKRNDKNVALSNLSIYSALKKVKKYTKIINKNFKLQHGIKSLNYLMGHVLYQIYRNFVSIASKHMRQLLIIL